MANIDELDELKSKHTKEKKDLQAKITGLKHSVTKNDKKRKKEVQLEIESLEKEQKERHKRELDELENKLKTTQIEDTPADGENTQKSGEDESTRKLTKTQKQRAKKTDAERRRQMAAQLDEESSSTGRGAIETGKIEEILKRKELRIFDIPSDGDCLFNAIAHQVNLLKPDSKFNGDLIRQKVADYMRNNSDEFLPFLENIESLDDFQKYCTKVEKSCRNGGDWGSATELKAASMTLERPIEVIHSDGPSHNFGEDFKSGALVITYHKSLLTMGEHYNSTLPVNVSSARLNHAERLQLVEKELSRSNSENLRQFEWDSDTTVAEQLLSGSFTDKLERTDMVKRLSMVLSQIRGNKKLREQVEVCRSTTYDSKSQEHEKKLLQLWELLKPDEKLLSRKTLQWQTIGFQGDDPSTDFRGMGILGLENLIYFAQHNPEDCRRLLKLSENEIYGFPFAIAGITLTALCKQLLFENYLKNHFANTLKTSPTIEHFNQVYCRVFTLFGDYWEVARPENVMFFNAVKNEFVELLKKYLKKSKADLFAANLASLNALKR